jgi:hypothetical protein
MPGISKKTFFKQNGKVLKNSQANTVYKEKVVSLFEPVLMVKPQRFKALRNYISTISNPNTKIVFGSISLALLIVLMFPFFTSIFRNSHPLTKTNGYSIFSSKPLTLETSTQDVDYKDSRAQKINEIFKAYSCPLEGLGNVFVSEADKNDIPWYLVAAVAFQESGCGKKTPKVNGEESYNAWGWGVYGNTTQTFENWVRGIETVSGYFGQKFFSKGIDDLCVIMKTYTPPSNGSWCAGVSEFADKITNYQTPSL